MHLFNVITLLTGHKINNLRLGLLSQPFFNKENNINIESTWSYNSVAADTDAWYGAIAESVGAWLVANDYGSVAAAVTDHETTGADISGLVQVFQNVNYNDLIA